MLQPRLEGIWFVLLVRNLVQIRHVERELSVRARSMTVSHVTVLETIRTWRLSAGVIAAVWATFMNSLKAGVARRVTRVL